MSGAAPSAFTMERIVSLAMATLENLRSEHGQVLESDDEVRVALESEGVDIATLMRRLVNASLEAKANQQAANARVNDLIVRRNRFKTYDETYRYTIQMALEALIPPDNAGIRRFADPEFGLTLTPGARRGVVVTDPELLPDEYVTVEIVRVPNLPLIKTALQADEVVPGAELAEPKPTLYLKTR